MAGYAAGRQREAMASRSPEELETANRLTGAGTFSMHPSAANTLVCWAAARCASESAASAASVAARYARMAGVQRVKRRPRGGGEFRKQRKMHKGPQFDQRAAAGAAAATGLPASPRRAW
jgi:hypothetical protein